MMRERAEFDSRWLAMRAAVAQRRLDEGEGISRRAMAGRGSAQGEGQAGEADNGGTALAEATGSRDGATRGAAGGAEHRRGDSSPGSGRLQFNILHAPSHPPRAQERPPGGSIQHQAGDQDGDERSPSKAATGGRGAGDSTFHQDQVSGSSSSDRRERAERAGAEVGFIGSLGSLGSVAEQQLTPEGRQGAGRFTSGG